jgi:hypothetical protein
MKRLMSTFCVAAACFVAAGVQSASASAGQAEKKMDTPVTVTGCVAAGAATGQYTLTNATLAPTATDKVPPAADKADKMSAPATSYTLKGGDDLKPHLGHKVQVTGTLAKPNMSTEKMPTTEAPKADKMMAGTLNVTSVKMVSPTCP